MPDIVISSHNGVKSTGSDIRTPEGYARVIRGGYFKQDDADRLWVLPGRTSAGTIGETTGVKDLSFLQDESTSKLLTWTNSKLYESDAAISGLSFSTARDADSTDFSQSGSICRAIHDGQKHWVSWSGVSGERPLLRDTEGVWRYLGLKKPGSITLEAIAAASATEVMPSAASSVTGYTALSDPDNAHDDDDATFASGVSTGDNYGSEFTAMDTADSTVNDTYSGDAQLNILFGTSSAPLAEDGEQGIADLPELPGSEALDASVQVKVTVDGGSNYTTIFDSPVPITKTTASVTLDSSITWANVQVQVLMTYNSGTTQVELKVFEIWTTGGSSTLVEDGTYSYVETEVVSYDGGSRTIESAPSDPVSVSLSSKYGTTITLSSRRNLTSDGIPDANITRRIYRSTSTGTWPDLGLIATVGIGETTYLDTFETAGTTLGSPTINTLTAQSVTLQVAGQPPSFQDAALYKGAVVAIPFDDPYKIQWSMPGYPDYWPLPAHDLPLSPSERQDKMIAIRVVNDNIILWERTRALRIQALPFLGNPEYDLTLAAVEVIDADHGLAGAPRSIATVPTAAGRDVVVWTSDAGLFATDGHFRGEGWEKGLGSFRLTENFDWKSEVDVSALSSSRLTYDPVDMLLYFDYDDKNGARRTLIFHMFSSGWVEGESGIPIPKLTGPHKLTIASRAIGELSSELKHWSLVSSTGTVYNERVGTKDNAGFLNSAGDIEYFEQSPWVYPGGPRGRAEIFQGSQYHSDWGRTAQGSITLESRRDASGIIRRKQKDGVSLLGSRITPLWWSTESQAIRLTKTFIGQATGAYGPHVLEANVYEV